MKITVNFEICVQSDLHTRGMRGCLQFHPFVSTQQAKLEEVLSAGRFCQEPARAVRQYPITPAE
jgi:hypothetical protein